LLGEAVHLTDRVIDIERDPIGLLGAGDQSWDLVGKPGQDSGTDLVELLDVTVSEGSQVGAQRRGRPDPKIRPMPP